MSKSSAPGGPRSVAGLTCVDFNPEMTGGATVDLGVGVLQFQRFPECVQKANQWLKNHGHLELRNCESVEYPVMRTLMMGSLEKSESSYSDKGSSSSYFRGLRLWTQPRRDGQSVVQQLGYYNILPDIRAGDSSAESADTLDALVLKTNAVFAAHPIQGKILTLETGALTAESGFADPDCSSWSESSRKTVVFMLRVFYILGPAQFEEVGIIDFMPAILAQKGQNGASLNYPKWAPFADVALDAHKWLAQQPDNISLLNPQMIMLRLPPYAEGMTINTLQTVHKNWDACSYFVRFLRLAFVTHSGEPGPGGVRKMSSPPAPAASLRLNYKLFVPGMIRPPGCLCPNGDFETQQQIKLRMSEWVTATGAKVLAVETLPMRIFRGAEQFEGFETMHTWTNYNRATPLPSMPWSNRDRAFDIFLILYKVYLDGIYPEPEGQLIYLSVEDYMRDFGPACQCTLL